MRCGGLRLHRCQGLCKPIISIYAVRHAIRVPLHIFYRVLQEAEDDTDVAQQLHRREHCEPQQGESCNPQIIRLPLHRRQARETKSAIEGPGTFWLYLCALRGLGLPWLQSAAHQPLTGVLRST